MIKKFKVMDLYGVLGTVWDVDAKHAASRMAEHVGLDAMILVHDADSGRVTHWRKIDAPEAEIQVRKVHN